MLLSGLRKPRPLSLSSTRFWCANYPFEREATQSTNGREDVVDTQNSLSLSLSLESTPLGEGTDARAQKKAGSAPAIIKAFPEKRNSL